MERNRLKLPLGIQTFEKLREGNCVYVDKTRYLVDLIDKVNICFLARPLTSTMRHPTNPSKNPGHTTC